MSTRIIVKNLPKNITEKQLKKHFSEKGEITDVKIMKKENGQSRNFCFIGYKDEKSAKNAVNYFNQTYLTTQKISVEIAKLQGDPSLKKKLFKGKKNNNKKNDDNIDEEKKIETKESKIKKILELANKTKNSSKFDEVAKKQIKDNIDNNNTSEKNEKNEKMDIEDNNQELNPKNKKEINEENKKDKNKTNKKEETSIGIEDNKKILDPKRLYLRNLPFKITEDDIKKQFEIYGAISEIHIPINHKTNESFGYAYISFETTESSIMALSKMDEEYFMGRKLHISIAEEKTSKLNNNNKEKKRNKNNENKEFMKESSYKKAKSNKLKASYNDETNWNYLFLNQNAVIETISKRLNISKEELLNKENSDIAVQISAMETTIINETKEWLKDQGINLDILKGKRSECIRSKNILFVKNISYNTNYDKLKNIFERYGSLTRFLLSPSNTLAICEYVNSKHAQNCIKHLAYYEIDNQPIYLEFAPEGILDKNIKEENNKKEEENDKNINLVENQGKILFVTNLDFSTNEKQLKHFFESKDYHVKKVEIVKHKKEGRNVSSGFGFVEFKDEETMLKALKNLQGRLLGGHSLKLNISKTSKNKNENLLGNKRKKETELNDYEYENENINNTKLLIKNLPFESNKEELRKLFKVYGQVKRVRLPTKMDGSIRGFGFVEFMSHDEAQKAFKELQNSHFYGRKIVIEWAQQEKSIEQLREDTRKKANVINIQTHRTQKKGKMYFK